MGEEEGEQELLLAPTTLPHLLPYQRALAGRSTFQKQQGLLPTNTHPAQATSERGHQRHAVPAAHSSSKAPSLQHSETTSGAISSLG